MENDTNLSIILVMKYDIFGVEARAGSLSEAIGIDGRSIFSEEALSGSLRSVGGPL